MSKPMGVLVPTKSRPQNMKAIVDAWWDTGVFGTAELIFVLDQDDSQYHGYLNEIRRLRSEGVKTIDMPDWQPLVPKLNQAAVSVAEEYDHLVFMGDDHLPRTPMWASKLLADHAFTKAAVVYGRDGFQDHKLPTWWSVDSRWVKGLGRMVPAPVQHMYCDNAVKTLGEKVGITYDTDILIEHMHPIAGKGTMDPQYARVNRAEQYDRDGAAFRAWMVDGLAEDARLLAGIWG